MQTVAPLPIKRVDARGRPFVPYAFEIVPETRSQALSLLHAVDDDLSCLTEPQRQAIRQLYRINGDNQSIEDLVRSGEIVP